MRGKLAQGDAADVAPGLELGDIFGDRIVEAELAPADAIRQQRRLKHFAQRGEVEQRVGRDRSPACEVGQAVVEEPGLAVAADRDRDPAGLAGHEQAPDVAGDHAGHVALGIRMVWSGHQNDAQCDRREARKAGNHCQDLSQSNDSNDRSVGAFPAGNKNSHCACVDFEANAAASRNQRLTARRRLLRRRHVHADIRQHDAAAQDPRARDAQPRGRWNFAVGREFSLLGDSCRTDCRVSPSSQK